MTKQMTLRELYEIELLKPTPAAEFVSKIANATQRKENTVRMWLSGRQQPDMLARTVIAELFDVDAETLFTTI